MRAFHSSAPWAAALTIALQLTAPAAAAAADDSRSAPRAGTIGDAGATTVARWHAAARDAIARQKPNQQAALRVLAYLSLAQHQAAQALAAQRAPASEAEWSMLFDRVSADVLAGLMPAQAALFQATTATAAANAAVNETVAAAESIAAAVAAKILARAAADGFDMPGAGAAPDSANAWRSQLQPPRPPHLPALGRMQPFYLVAGDALRPAAPPAIDSAAFAAALDEVRTRSKESVGEGAARARRWEMTSGSLVAGYWDESALQLAAGARLNGPATSRVLALTLGATLDANIACHDAKYVYWTPRPSQVDPSIRPIIGLPNHPSYPSNHSCDSGAAAEVLALLFPAEAERLRARAVEAGESRIDAGLHYRFDLDAGLAIGRAAARAALGADGSQQVAEAGR